MSCLPKLFRQTVPQRWPGGGKTAVTELIARSLDQTRSIVSRLQIIDNAYRDAHQLNLKADYNHFIIGQLLPSNIRGMHASSGTPLIRI